MTVEPKLMTGETFEQFLATHPEGLYELQQFPDKNQRHMCWTTGPVKRGPSYYV